MSYGLPPGAVLDPDYDQLFSDADAANGLPSGMTRAIADAETGFLGDWSKRNVARSPAGAIGPVQFMPATGERFGLHGQADLTDPTKAIPAAGRYLGELYREFGTPDLAAAAYNAGEGAVRKHHGIPPYRETQRYVPRVMKNLASSRHAALMREKYGSPPSHGGGLFDALISSAMADESVPTGNGVMLPAGALLDPEPQAAAAVLPDGAVLDPEPQQQSGLSPALQTGIRSTVRGVTAPFVMAADAINSIPNVIAKGVNAVVPGTMGYIPSASGYVDAGLRGIGITPESQSTPERAITAGLGAAVGSPLFGLQTAGQQAAAAATGTLASEAAGQAGLPAPVQIGAGVIGGMLPGVGAGVMQAAGGAMKRAGAPFTTGGKESIAGRVLRKQSSAPESTLARVSNPDINREFIPGSRPTLAEVSQDPGLARLQAVADSSQAFLNAGADQINRMRLSQMDDMIRSTLDRVNKVPSGGRADMLDRITDVKQRIGKEFEDSLTARGIDPQRFPVDPVNTISKLRELAQRHEGNDALTAIINRTSSTLGDEAPSFNKLWNMRQSLDDAIYEKWATSTASSKGDMKRLGEQIRRAMNDDLVAAAPEFRPFLDRYARMARAEGRLRLGRELVDKAENTARNIASGDELYGDRVISGAKLDRPNIAGAERKSGSKLGKAQRDAFAAAQEETRRANILATGGAPINSRTAQNIAINQIITDDILGGLFGDKPRGGLTGIMQSMAQNTIGAPLSALTRHAQDDVIKMIARGLVDPEEGARLMRLGQLSGTESFANRLRGAARSGVLAEMYSNMAR